MDERESFDGEAQNTHLHTFTQTSVEADARTHLSQLNVNVA